MLTGSSHGETEPKKATYRWVDVIRSEPQVHNPTSLEICIPPLYSLAKGKSKGFKQSKWLHLKEHNNLSDGTNKNGSKV